MISNNTPYLPRLDHLRFVAAALVVAYHFGSTTISADTRNPLLLLIKHGYNGVSLFMVISGFILTQISLNREVVYSSFLFNRFLRIYPLYILFIFAEAFSGSRRVDFISFIALATFTGNLGGIATVKFPHLWTVMVEFQFYLIFPFLVRFFGRLGFRYLLGVLGVANLLRTVIYLLDGSVQESAYWTILGRIDQFAIGMILAAIHQHRRSMFSHVGWLLLGCSLVVGWVFLFGKWCGGYYGNGSPHSISTAWIVAPTFEAVAYGGLVLAYLHQKWRLPSTADRALAYLGAISYSIYVWHFSIVLLVQKYSASLPFESTWIVLVAVVFPVIIAVSSLSFFVIEKPFFWMRTVYVKDPSSH
jgi:peptidoglycan/LPS O-acetylase OafA/YrhL